MLRPTDVTVSINPADRAALEEAMPRLAAGLPNLTHVRLVDDLGVTRGGCVISYGHGRIDATIETQFDRLVELLRNMGWQVEVPLHGQKVDVPL